MQDSLTRLKQHFAAKEASMPLARFIELYSKAPTAYLDYMEGARLLKDWIGYITIPENLPIMPQSILHNNYELNRLASMLAGAEYGAHFAKVKNAIIYHEVLRLLQKAE